jgi:hypothetical protein
MNEKQLNEVMEAIKKSDAVLIETNNTSTVVGSNLDIMALFCKMAHTLINKTTIDADMLHEGINMAKDAPADITEKDVKDAEKNSRGILEALDKLLTLLGKDED